MTGLRSRLHEENGIAMVMAIFLGSILTLIAIMVIDTVAAESNRSGTSVRRQAAFQAAEAGLDSYIAKLLEDRFYYGHYVGVAESTRRPVTGADVAPGIDGFGNPAATAWPYAASWTYPSGKNNWKSLGNGYEYNIEISPPSASATTVRIEATGRNIVNPTDRRVIEATVRPSSIADFQMLANRDIAYGATATTRGKLYAGRDEFGVAHSINHAGTAYQGIYAEGSITGAVTMMNGALKYTPSTTPSIRTVIKQEINFSAFLASLSDIQRASQSGGVYLDIPTARALRLTFISDGTFTTPRRRRTSPRPSRPAQGCRLLPPTTSRPTAPCTRRRA
jgi:hypothetical protein